MKWLGALLLPVLFLFGCGKSGSHAEKQGPINLGAVRGQFKSKFKVVDVHVHLVGGRGNHQDYEGAVHKSIRRMDHFGIRMAIILPPPQVEDQEWYDYESFVDALKLYPGRFVFLGGGGRLNSLLHRYREPSSVTENIKKTFAHAAEKILKNGAIGFGEIASLHISAVPGHPFEYVPTDHPLLLVLADVAAKRDVVIDLHMDAVANEMPVPNRFKEGDNPSMLPRTLDALSRLLAHNRKAKIVWAHGGSDPTGGMTPSFIGQLMDRRSNLYVSLRIVGGRAPMHNKALAFGVIEPGWNKLLTRHSDRFVIGTDSFFVSPSVEGSGPGVQFSQRNIQKLKATMHFLSLLPSFVARKIAIDNAVRIYKLKI